MFGQTAVAASVDLRCFGLTQPRYDNKISVHFTDISDFKYEWDVEQLPWDAAPSVPKGEDHPDALDQRLVDAIKTRALPPESEMPPKTQAAAIAFLYLYMMMAHGTYKSVASLIYPNSSSNISPGLCSISSCARHSPSALAWALPRLSQSASRPRS